MFSFGCIWCVVLAPIPALIWFFTPTKEFVGTKHLHNHSIAELIFPNLLRLHIDKYQKSHNPQHMPDNKLFLILLSLFWILLVLALMQPQIVSKQDNVNYKGYDIMLALDLSDSMAALDFATKSDNVNRLDVTKNVVANFLSKRRGDRVGLILFGEHAYLHVPLTSDLVSLAKMLSIVQIGMAGHATSIGDAIGLAVKFLRNKKDTKILILLTDGEDNSSTLSPIFAASLAKNYGIRIYTIAVGKDGAVPYPNPLGGITMQRMPVNRDILMEIANMTGGKFFEATDKETLFNIYNDINLLEKIDIERKEYFISTPLFRYPLFMALIMFMLIGLIPLLKKEPKQLNG